MNVSECATPFRFGELSTILAVICLAACNTDLRTPTEPSSVRPMAAMGATVAPTAVQLGNFIGRFDARLFGALANAPAAVPGAPSGLAAQVAGNTVTLTWNPATGDPTTYVLEAGSASGLADLANFATGNLATVFTAIGVPAGTYFVRIRAANASGVGAVSNEVAVVVGCTAAPPAPAALMADVKATTVTLNWNAAPDAISYQLEAGSASGLADLFNGDVGPTTTIVASVPPGTYFVRVRAQNSCGGSDPSNEVKVVVGLVCTPIPLVPVSIGFNGLVGNGSSFGGYAESGFTVQPTAGSWTTNTLYGKPAPFIQFLRLAGQPTLTAAVSVTTGGYPFHFGSVDLYSSVTTIPYVVTGLRDSQTVFMLSNTVPNTFGNFATVPNPNPAQIIDTLAISLSNPGSGCCSNPVGLDNIVVARRCGETGPGLEKGSGLFQISAYPRGR